jgi:hypothetical protein
MNTLICTAIVWALFFGIHFIFGADSDGFWGAFVMLGILGPIYVAFTSVRTSVRKTTLSDQGVDTGQYIPMFVHHSGLPKLADKQGTYVAALKSKDELVFFSCESWVCKKRSEDFLNDFKSEVARIRIRDIESVFAIPAESDVSDRSSTEISEFIVNNTLGSLLGRKRHTTFYDAFIVIVVSRPSRQHLVFAVPSKIAGAPILSTFLHFVPEEVSKTFEALDTTNEAIEALTVEAEDPEAVKSAKKVAVEILGLKARLAA